MFERRFHFSIDTGQQGRREREKWKLVTALKMLFLSTATTATAEAITLSSKELLRQQLDPHRQTDRNFTA